MAAAFQPGLPQCSTFGRSLPHSCRWAEACIERSAGRSLRCRSLGRFVRTCRAVLPVKLSAPNGTI